MKGLSMISPSRVLPIHPRHAVDAVWRPFFITAILVMITAGAAWGTWLLIDVGRATSFTGVSIHSVNAHGHAQIFGWVGLFIMGFAYQAFPRIWGTRLSAPHLAPAAFVLMVIGLVTSAYSIWTAETWSLAVPGATIGGLLQIAAVALFASQIVITFLRSEAKFEPYVGFIFLALGWFLAMSVMSHWHTLALMQADSREALLTQLATYQAALRDMQVHGLAMFMIFGVSIRMLPRMFGLPETPAWRGWSALGLLTIAVIGEVVLLIASQRTGNTALAGALIVPWLLLAGGIALLVLPWRLWRPFPPAPTGIDRSEKFIRTAYLWLGISLLMLLLMPVYLYLFRGLEFSHAYYGAVRHAVTVGFVSMMIMGFAAKVVPMLCGMTAEGLSRLWGPFILVNAGCALRVSTQVFTDFHGAFFPVIALSGMLELSAFAWWGLGLLAIMWKGARIPQAIIPPPQEDAEMLEIRLEMTMRDVVNAYPKLLPTMTQLGLDTCCSADRTVRQMAEQRGVEPHMLQQALALDMPGLVNGEPTRKNGGCGCGCRAADAYERAGT
jgi:hypothetical protein